MTISTALTITDYILSPVGDAIDSGRIVRRWWDAEGAPMARYGWALARPYVAAAGIALLVVAEFAVGLAEMAWSHRGRVLPAVDAALEWAFQCGDEATTEESSVVEVMPVVEPTLKESFAEVARVFENLEAVSEAGAPTLEELFADVERVFANPVYQDEQVEVESVDLTALTAQQLRLLCVESGIQWRHAHGKNRHLTKAQMIEALS